MEDKMTKSNGSSTGPAPHHHCCHHHTATPHSCHQWGTSSVDSTHQDLYFRPRAAEGLWLPALLPLACICVCAVAWSASSISTAVLAVQSCACCYQLRWGGYCRPSSSPHGPPSADRSGATSGVVLRPLPPASASSSQLVLLFSAAVLLCLAAGAGVMVSVLVVVLNTVVVRVAGEWLAAHHSRTFSVGEWLFVAECTGLCVSYCLCALACGCPTDTPYTLCQLAAFLQLSALVSAVLLTLLLLLPRPSLVAVVPLVGAVGVGGVFWSSLLLGEFSPLWLLQELVGRHPQMGLRRPLLLGWWGVCSGVAWACTAWVYRYQSAPVSVVRKVYHGLAVGVCVAGVASDPAFLCLASVGASIACLLAEALRTMDVPLVAPLLTSAFSNFLDEKDQNGTLILSPVYLLVGMCLPLWLLPTPVPYCVPCPSSSDVWESSALVNMALLQLSGVLAVGIGDTFASLGGTRYGVHKFPGSNKSLEGSLCGVGSQVAAVLVLVLCGVVQVGRGGLVWWSGVAVTVVVASLVEAFTDQVDNLALPLVTFIGFCWTEYAAAA